MPREASVSSPFADAVAVWHMGDDGGSAGAPFRLAAQGDVTLGVELAGAEREASLRRGGDGRVAHFKGGYLTAGDPAARAVRLGGDRMTFCIRLRDPSGTWATPLFARHAPDDAFGKVLYPAPLNERAAGFPQRKRIREGKAVEFLWRTTPLAERVHADYLTRTETADWFKFVVDGEAKYTPSRKGDFVNGVLRLQAPVELIGSDRWLDVVVRFSRAKLEMFVDGVRLDEDWPHGGLHAFRGPFLIGAGFHDGDLRSGFHGQVDHVALWDRALSDDEVLALSGGAGEAARRDVEILGPTRPVTQYWRPRGYNIFVGDCMAFSHDGTFHVLFLSDRGHGTGKWGMLGSPWGHVSTEDFVHWKEHPRPLDITEPWECCLGTGCLVHQGGRYHLFYIKHDRRAWFKDNPNRGDAVFVATSDDGIHFEKEPEPLFVPDFFEMNDINPDVYPNETDGGSLLSLSNWKVWKSDDLTHWEERPPLGTPPWWVCTSYFRWNDWYYFTSCGRHWRSREPIETAASWTEPPHETLRDGIRVAQVAAFKGRHIMVGFTPEPPDTSYAGELLVRELIQHPDGTLGTKWPEEMIPASGAPLTLPFHPSVGDASAEGSTIRVRAADGPAAGALAGVPQDARITLRANPEAGARRFGLCVRAQGNCETGCELRFEPAEGRVWFAPASGDRSAGPPDPWMAIDGVTGLERSFTLDLIVKDDLVDACIDGRRTLITRDRAGLSGDRLFFFVEHGDVTFGDIQVRPLLT